MLLGIIYANLCDYRGTSLSIELLCELSITYLVIIIYIIQGLHIIPWNVEVQLINRGYQCLISSWESIDREL